VLVSLFFHGLAFAISRIDVTLTARHVGSVYRSNVASFHVLIKCVRIRSCVCCTCHLHLFRAMLKSPSCICFHGFALKVS